MTHDCKRHGTTTPVRRAQRALRQGDRTAACSATATTNSSVHLPLHAPPPPPGSTRSRTSFHDRPANASAVAFSIRSSTSRAPSTPIWPSTMRLSTRTVDRRTGDDPTRASAEAGPCVCPGGDRAHGQALVAVVYRTIGSYSPPFAVPAILAVIVDGSRRRPDAGMLDTRSHFGRIRFATFGETMSSARSWPGLADPA
jgi:hypothetical protein